MSCVSMNLFDGTRVSAPALNEEVLAYGEGGTYILGEVSEVNDTDPNPYFVIKAFVMTEDYDINNQLTEIKIKRPSLWVKTSAMDEFLAKQEYESDFGEIDEDLFE